MSQSCVAVAWLEDGVDKDGQGAQAWRDAAWRYVRRGDGKQPECMRTRTEARVQTNEGQGDIDEASAGARCCMGHVEADGL